MANVYGGFNRCAPPSYCRPGTAVAPVTNPCKCNNGFLLLLLLFILLAAGPSWGIDNSFFFIIILAIIAFGGFGRTFGFNSAI